MDGELYKLLCLELNSPLSRRALYHKRGHEGDNVRSDSTPLGVNNKVPLKVSQMC